MLRLRRRVHWGDRNDSRIRAGSLFDFLFRGFRLDSRAPDPPGPTKREEREGEKERETTRRGPEANPTHNVHRESTRRVKLPPASVSLFAWLLLGSSTGLLAYATLPFIGPRLDSPRTRATSESDSLVARFRGTCTVKMYFEYKKKKKFEILLKY